VVSGEEISSFPLPERAFGLAFNRAGTRLATTIFQGSLLVWDTSDPQAYKELYSLPASINSVLFSPDGSRLFTGEDLPRIWDLAQREIILTLPGHENRNWGLALSPDGRYLATASYDGTARIYTLDFNMLMDLARTRISRWFTPEECQEFLHMETCPQAPWDIGS
jgi:WD40 repeat protein